MNNDFTAALGRAMEHTRAGNPAEATRLIQAALSGAPAPAPAPAAKAKVAPPAPSVKPGAKAPIEDAEIISETPPRRGPMAGFAMPSGLGQGRVDLQQMLGKLGAMAPQGLNGLPQGLTSLPQGLPGSGKTPAIPEGARYETRHFTSKHGARDYRLFVPSSLPDGPKGLILMLHGCTQNPDDFACGTDMNSHAERHGLILVYPHQSRAHNAQGCWNWFRPEDQRAASGEAALLAALAREVRAEFAVPEGAVYAAGLSAGGAMAATLAATHPELFAAVGVHSGLPHGAAHDMPSAFAAMRGQQNGGVAKTQGSVRMIIFHGSADATVHPSNAKALFASTGAGAHGKPRRETGTTKANRSWSRDIVKTPDGTVLVEAWTITGAGHAWSGGSPDGSFTDPSGPDASAEMVRFFMG